MVDFSVTWSMLSLSGSRLIRRQHSGPPRPDSGDTCRAFTVSWEHTAHHQTPGHENSHSERPALGCLTMLEWALRGMLSLV